MCGFPAVMFGLQAASAISGASAKNAALEKAAKGQAVSAQRQIESTFRQRLQRQKKADIEIDAMMRDVDRARSASAVANIESGVAGGSAGEVLQELTKQGLEAETGMRQSFAYGSQELGYVAEDIGLNLKNKQDELRSQAVSNLELFAQIGQSAMSTQMFAVQSGMIPEGSGFLGIGSGT